MVIGRLVIAPGMSIALIAKRLSREGNYSARVDCLNKLSPRSAAQCLATLSYPEFAKTTFSMDRRRLGEIIAAKSEGAGRHAIISPSHLGRIFSTTEQFGANDLAAILSAFLRAGGHPIYDGLNDNASKIDYISAVFTTMREYSGGGLLVDRIKREPVFIEADREVLAGVLIWDRGMMDNWRVDC